MNDDRLRIVAVSDYICPWCYVGSAQLDRLQRELDVDVEWWPFELHPGIPPEGIARDPSSPRAAARYEQLRLLAEAAGLPFRPPTFVPNSHLALEAGEFAREHGAFEAMDRVLFRAYFAEGRNIGDIAVLAGIASDCGLDGGALRQSLESSRYAPPVDASTRRAREAGVASTPTSIFISGDLRFPLVGAQDYAVFENVARRLGARERTPQPEPAT
jgi:predicted DsbA family dithiol-disulfide isomerase